MFVHVPIELRDAFDHQRYAFFKAAGLTFCKDVISTERIGPRGIDWNHPTKRHRQSYQNGLEGVLRYLGKTIDPDAKSSLHRHLPPAERPTAAAALGITPEYSHPIYGRRISVSQNIGPAARKRFEAERHRQALAAEARARSAVGFPKRRTQTAGIPI